MDINDIFEQILLSEERIAEESYKKGFEKGVSEGNLKAYHIGNLYILEFHKKIKNFIFYAVLIINRIS